MLLRPILQGCLYTPRATVPQQGQGIVLYVSWYSCYGLTFVFTKFLTASSAQPRILSITTPSGDTMTNVGRASMLNFVHIPSGVFPLRSLRLCQLMALAFGKYCLQIYNYIGIACKKMHDKYRLIFLGRNPKKVFIGIYHAPVFVYRYLLRSSLYLSIFITCLY